MRHFRTIGAAVLLCCFASSARGDGQSASGDGDVVYHLHGKVVDGVTGKPLARALVKSNDGRMAVMTGNEGQFAVDLSVPVAVQNSGNTGLVQSSAFRRSSPEIYLSLQKPGYITPSQPQIVALNDTLSTTDIKLKLMPAATISGRVSAANAESFANVQVMLLARQSLNNGRLTWRQASFSQTNVRGEFHFADLRPGEYTVLTREWNGDQPLPQPLSQGHAEITQRYPPTYYGDVSSLDAAVKLPLHYGDNLQTELHLHLATYYPVTVPVTNPTPDSSVAVRVTGQDIFNNLSMRYNQRTGSVEGSLPKGQYTLLLSSGQQFQTSGSVQARGAVQPQQSYALVTFDVAEAPVQTAAVALAPGVPIAVRIHAELTQTGASQSRSSGRFVSGEYVEGTAPLVQLSLQSEDNTGSYGGTPSQPGHNDELVLQNVPPGHYSVEMQAMRGYVASASCAGIDLLQQPLVVGAGGLTSPIEVVVRDDNPQVSGVVTSGGDPLPQQVFLVLLLRTDVIGQFTMSYAGSDGKFTEHNLAPGGYRALALPSSQFQLTYRDPETMHRFDGKGVTFSAGAGQVLNIEVPLVTDADLTDMGVQ